MSENDLERSVIKFVFFDLDGTLTDYRASVERTIVTLWDRFRDRIGCDRRSFREAYWDVASRMEAAERSGEITTQRLKDRTYRFAEILKALDSREDSELAIKMGRHFGKGRVRNVVLFPEVHEVLCRLAAAGLKLGVITEGKGEDQRTQLVRAGLIDMFEVIVISDEVGLHKPDPNLYRYSLELTGIPAERVALVGDRPDWDLAPGRSAGMRTILFTQGSMYDSLEGYDEFVEFRAGDFLEVENAIGKIV